jgi:polysaccharide biosynthesis transport protein
VAAGQHRKERLGAFMCAEGVEPMSRNYDLLQLIDNKSKVLQPGPKSTEHYGDSSFGKRFEWAHDVQGLGWTHLLSVLQKHWRLSALFAVFVFVVVAIATLLTRPVYEPAVTLEIDPPGTQALSLERSTGEGPDDAQYLETQAKKLQSDELALAVIRKLGLDHNPDFVDTSRPDQNREQAVHTNEGAVQLGSSENAALNTFRTRLKVQRDTGSRLVTVSFASHDSRTAAQVVNMLVSEFIHNNFAVRHEAIMETSAWLSRQLDDLRDKMDQSNRVLVTFQQKTGIADLDQNKSTLAERMAELDRQLALAESDRIQFEALLGKAQKASPESLPQIGDNPVVQQLTQKVAESRAELSKAQVDYGNNHPTLKKLQNEVDQLQTELDSQRHRIWERLLTGYATAKSRERLLERQRKLTAKQLDQLAQYNTLKKEFQTETELYNSLYARVKEAGIAAASNSYNFRVIDHARVLRHPSQPRTLVNLCFGLLAAVFGGLMIACVREALDNRIHTPEDIRNATGVPTISVLPVIREDDAAPGTAFAHYLKISRNGNYCVSKFLLERPNSAAAEALRGLHTTMMHSREGRLPQVVLVISALAGEGKTTIASNLGIALARRGPTCLADADLRRAGASRAFGLQGRRGLADLLSGSAGLEDAITQVPDVPNLSIVPSGTADENPGELMAYESVLRVITALRERFHFVVLDSPPILPYADGRVLSTLVDGLIVVVRYLTTTRAAITRTVEVLSEIHSAPIMEVVLNGGDSMVSDSQYYRTGKRT